MTTVQKIEQEIEHLKPDELARFRDWFDEFDAAQWDKQFEKDVKAGKLDSIAKKALTDLKKNKYKEL